MSTFTDGRPEMTGWEPSQYDPQQHRQRLTGGLPGAGGYLPPQPPPRKSWPRRHKVLTGIITLGVLGVIGGAAGAAGSDGKAQPVSAPSVPAIFTSSPPAPSPSQDPLDAVYASVCGALDDGASASDVAAVADEDLKKDGITGYTGTGIVQAAEKKDCPSHLAAAAEPASPAMTASQQQAVTAAQNYLDLGTGFSYKGLLQQLTSGYGSGFSQADAKFAIRYLHPDWNAQAVEAAKGYMQLGTGFSRSSLIEQLTSSYGSGFTEAQAEYAADQVGL